MSQYSDNYGLPPTGAGRLPSAAGRQSPTKSADKYSSSQLRYSSICDSGLGSLSSGTESLRQSAAEEELQSHLSSVSITESREGVVPDGSPRPSDARAALSADSLVRLVSTADYFRQDADGDTQLHVAIILGNADLVYRIVATGPTRQQINLRNDLQQTALHLAVSTKQPQVVRSLLGAGAELLARDWRGNTAAHLACRDGELDCLRELVGAVSSAVPPVHPTSWQQRSAFDVHNYEGVAPLHLAAAGGHNKLVSFLVDNRVADINFQEAKAGRTLLHLAVERDDLDLLKLALQLGAEPGVCAYNGARPAAVARAWRRGAISDLLKEYEEGLPADSSSSSSGAEDSIADGEEMDYSDQGYDDIQINGLPVAVNSL